MARYYNVEGMGKAGPYTQAVEANGFIYLSGVVPIDYETGQLVDANIAEATRQVLQNIRRVLAACNASLSEVVKATVFLTDMGNFQGMNEVYKTCFAENPPARSAVAVRELPLGAMVEIEVIVARKA